MQKVQVFRCEICGDPYIGFGKPTNCPFCGAHEQYMVPSEKWKDTNDVDLTDVSRKNLEAALELEMSNTEFYLCVSRTSKSEEMKAMFKALSKVESEHADTICKILKAKKPEVKLKEGLCSSMSDEEILAESDRRENRAVRLYTEFLKQATETRLKQFFTALVEIESDHIDLVNEERGESVSLSKETRDNPPSSDDSLKQLDREDLEYYESYKAHRDG